MIRHMEGNDHKRWEAFLRNQHTLNLAISNLLYNTSKAKVLAPSVIVKHNLQSVYLIIWSKFFREKFLIVTLKKNYASAQWNPFVVFRHLNCNQIQR